MSRRIPQAIAAFAAILGFATVAAAQSPVSVRVQSSVTGATFWVDGQPYLNSAVFSWPEGSKHTLEVRQAYKYANAPEGITSDPKQYDPSFKTRFSFQGWRSSNGIDVGLDQAVISITADRKVNSYTASFLKEHGILLLINKERIMQYLGPCNGNQRTFPGTDFSPSRAGYLQTSICGCMSTSGYAWVTEGTQMQLTPVAYPGYVFAGFDNPPGPAGYAAAMVIVDRPMTINANFVQARRVFLESAPQRGFQVQVDHTLIQTKRHDLDCLPLSTAPGYPWQTVAFPDLGAVWSDDRVCKNVPLCTGELDLLPGTDHVLGAPPAQKTPDDGRTYVFDHWDTGDGNKYPANSVVRIPADHRGLTFTARFVEGARVAVRASQFELKILVDDVPNTLSYLYDWGVGHSHKVSAPLEQRDAKGRLWRFKGWSNGGEAEQTVIVPAEAAEKGLWLMAEYELLGQLAVKSQPGALQFTVDGQPCATPCVVDRAAGSQVTIAPVAEQEISPETKIEMTGWENGATGERVYTFSQQADTLTARYQYMHKISLVSDPEGGADWTLEPAAGPGWFFTAGVPVEVKVKANKGFKFRRFEGSLSGTLPEGQVTMSGPRVVVARFDEVPELAEGAVQNAAGETPDKVVAPGSLIAIKGIHLASGDEVSKTNPAAQSLLGVTAQVRDSVLPLVFVTPWEIQAQLYSHFTPGEHTLTLNIPGQPKVSAKFQVDTYAPGLFRNPEFEQPVAEAFHTNGKPVTPADPAKPGETVLLCGTGFGPLKTPWLDGFLVPLESQIALKTPFEFFLNGQAHPVLAAYAQQNRIGKVVIRFQLGNDPMPSAMVPMKVRIGTRESNTVLLPVKAVAVAEAPEAEPQE
jgi:uncharacterized protein (TIGR03437 family)